MKSNKKLNLQKRKISEIEFSVIDFETTGLDANLHRAIEIAIVKVKNKKIIDTWASLINPEQQIPYFITQLTGISNAEVLHAPNFTEIAEQIFGLLDNTVVVAHNLNFDKKFLLNEFRRTETPPPFFQELCTLRLSKKMFPKLRSKSLEKVGKHLRIQHKNVHRALGDATVTAKILIRMIKRLQSENDIENIDDLLRYQNKSNSELPKYISKTLANDANKFPAKPGVYFYKNISDKIIYIGKAKSLKKRIANYFTINASDKAKKIVTAASNVNFITTNSELSALILEAELIKKYKPKFNSQLKKFSRTYFIKISRNSSTPDIKSVGQFQFDDSDYFGPYSNRHLVAMLLEVLNKTFKLRECSAKEFKKKSPCYLYDIHRCLGPCFKNCTREYQNEIDNVYSFLGGNNQTAINILLTKMKKFSNEMKFEEAAEIRDTVQQILKYLNRTAIIESPINKSSVLVKTLTGTTEYFLLIKGKFFIKNDPTSGKDDFETAIEDYYSGTLFMINELTERDLERTRIALAWMATNRTNLNILNLNNYTSPKELYSVL